MLFQPLSFNIIEQLICCIIDFIRSLFKLTEPHQTLISHWIFFLDIFNPHTPILSYIYICLLCSCDKHRIKDSIPFFIWDSKLFKCCLTHNDYRLSHHSAEYQAHALIEPAVLQHLYLCQIHLMSVILPVSYQDAPVLSLPPSFHQQP